MGRSAILFFLIGLLGCSEEEPLIRTYSDEWQLDVGARLVRNGYQPELGEYKTTVDGSLLMVFAWPALGGGREDYSVVKVSETGQIAKQIDLPSGYAAVGLRDSGDGYVFTITNDRDKPDFINVHVSSNLDITQSPFTFTRPTTFHLLTFSETGIFQIEYSSSRPFTRIRKYDYQEQLQWDRNYYDGLHNLHLIEEQSNLMSFRKADPDSLIITTINGTDGEITWRKAFKTTELFGTDGGRISFGYRLIDDIICITQFDDQSHTFYLARISSSNGRLLSIQSTDIEPDFFPYLGTLTRDGGYVLVVSDQKFRYLYKTDRDGKTGWKGKFANASIRYPIETVSGDLYLVVDKAYVYKLLARK